MAEHNKACGSSCPRASRERGATLLEFALVFPLLLLLIFAVVDFGVAYNDWNSVRQGSREGARQAVVGETGTVETCPIVGATAANTVTKQLICLTKDRTGLNRADTRIKIGFGAAGYDREQPLLVCVQYPLRSTTGLLSPVLNGTLRSKAQMRTEETTVPALVAVAEDPVPGGDWSWCAVS